MSHFSRGHIRSHDKLIFPSTKSLTYKLSTGLGWGTPGYNALSIVDYKIMCQIKYKDKYHYYLMVEHKLGKWHEHIVADTFLAMLAFNEQVTLMRSS